MTDRWNALLQLAQALQETGYHFTTITPASQALVNARPGNQWADRLEDVFGWSRRFRASVMQPLLLALMRDAGILAEDGTGWRSLVRFSNMDGRLLVHSSYPTSEPDAVFLGPDTYKFADAIRMHLMVQAAPVGRAVDICCGTGAGALAIAGARPEAEVAMVDINDTALQFARVNTALAGADKVSAYHSDLLSAVDGAFDLIVAHPPYLVDRGTRVYRHGGGPLGAGLALSIIHTAAERLAPGGTLLLFTGVAIVRGDDPFRQEAASILPDAEFRLSYREVDPDVFGEELAHPPYDQVDRIALVVLTATRR